MEVRGNKEGVFGKYSLPASLPGQPVLVGGSMECYLSDYWTV